MSDTYMPPPPPAPGQHDPYGQPQAKGSNGLATAGFVLALLGLLICWIPLLNVVGILLAIVGVILAAIGLAKSKKAGTGRGLAIAGIVLGALAVLFAIIINVAFVGAVDDAVDEVSDTSVVTPADTGGAGSAEGGTEGEAGDAGSPGATRDNPAPLGSEISGDDWTVTINSVENIDEDSLGSTAEAGSTLVSINMTATYNGDDEQGQTPFTTVNFVTPDGESIDAFSGSTLFIADNEFDSLTTVYPGSSVTGDSIFEVPAEGWQNGVLAVSPGLLSDDTFVAVQ